MKNHRNVLEKRLFLTVLVAVVITGALTITSLGRSTSDASSVFCSFVGSYIRPNSASNDEATPTHLAAILHYATSRVIPQQLRVEITVAFDVLRHLAPCNFLMFGLGYDSLMWSSFNPRGTTLFLEDDVRWVHRVVAEGGPALRVHQVQYQTRISEAEDLLTSYKSVPQCLPPGVTLRGNSRCKLALRDLPDEVYDKDWDAIIIDGPRGYLAESPGRMSVIFSAAVMAKNRVRPGPTHVFVHDVHRKVDKAYAEEFLCRKYLVRAVGRLWHFEIPSGAEVRDGFTFC